MMYKHICSQMNVAVAAMIAGCRRHWRRDHAVTRIQALDRVGPCAMQCCSQFNACVYALHNGDMARGDADVLLGYKAAAAAAACHGSPHATWLLNSTLVLVVVREEAHSFELGYEEHTVSWGTLIGDLLPLAIESGRKFW